MTATTAKLQELLALIGAASPGPWAAKSWTKDERGDYDRCIIADRDGNEILVYAATSVPQEQIGPNSNLAAAAPALARLVLALSEEAGTLVQQLDGHPEGLCTCKLCTALAAVEELAL